MLLHSVCTTVQYSKKFKKERKKSINHANSCHLPSLPKYESLHGAECIQKHYNVLALQFLKCYSPTKLQRHFFFFVRLWLECPQAVLQSGSQRLSARPAPCQEGVQLRPDHSRQSPQHQETHGGRYVYTGNRAKR